MPPGEGHQRAVGVGRSVRWPASGFFESRTPAPDATSTPLLSPPLKLLLRHEVWNSARAVVTLPHILQVFGDGMQKPHRLPLIRRQLRQSLPQAYVPRPRQSSRETCPRVIAVLAEVTEAHLGESVARKHFKDVWVRPQSLKSIKLGCRLACPPSPPCTS